MAAYSQMPYQTHYFPDLERALHAAISEAIVATSLLCS